MYKYILSTLLFLFCLSCNRTNESFFQVYEQAQRENKYLWINLNFGTNKNIFNNIDQYRKSHEAQAQKYIFRQFDLLDSANTYLNYILLIENINNSYLFNPQGEIISFQYGEITDKTISNQLNAVKIGVFPLPTKLREFNSTPDSLTKMFNLTLQAYMLYKKNPNNSDSLQQASNLLEKAIGIEPYFYNLYLKSKILKAQKATNAIKYAELAIKYCNNNYQNNTYTQLRKELIDIFNINLSSVITGLIQFDNTTQNAGNILLNSQYEFKFPFRNIGKEPVIITHVSSTCGCAIPYWPKEPIAPNQKSEISVTFNAEKYGTFIRSILVQSTAQNSVERLLLRGAVTMQDKNLTP